MAVLQIIDGDRRGETIGLAGNPVTFGRSVENTVSLPGDARMSRQHARVRQQGDFWYLEDLDSANGTFLERGGQSYRVGQPTQLYDGDVLTIGSLRAAVAGMSNSSTSASATQNPTPAATEPPPRQEGYAAVPPVQRAGLGGSWQANAPQSADLQTLWQRLLRVAQIDATAFQEIRRDSAATWPALIVVALAALLSGLGGWLLYLFSVPAIARDSGEFFLRSAFLGSIIEVALWFAWVGTTMLLLQRVWRRQVDFAELVRTMGLAFFPVGVSLFAFINGLATAISLIALAAAVLLSGVALEATVEATPAERLLANLAGFAVFAIGLSLLGHNGQYAPGLFAFSF